MCLLVLKYSSHLCIRIQLHINQCRKLSLLGNIYLVDNCYIEKHTTSICWSCMFLQDMDKYFELQS